MTLFSQDHNSLKLERHWTIIVKNSFLQSHNQFVMFTFVVIGRRPGQARNFWFIRIDNGACWYSCLKNVLSSCNSVLTFILMEHSACPKPYKQIVTIRGNYWERVLPLAFCMLGSKATGLYHEMLQQLKRHVMRLTSNDLTPARTVCDFEISLMSAIQSEFPGTTLHGCFFHFCQSLWRKIEELGMTTVYGQNPSIKKVIRKIMSLGYLPTAVRMTFNLIYSSYTISCLMNQN